MQRKVEATVKGGKKGEPISHWMPASFFLMITSFRQRIRISFAVSMAWVGSSAK